MNAIERRLRRLEQQAETATREVFLIYACDDRDLHQHFGIIQKPHRELRVLKIGLVGKVHPEQDFSDWETVGYVGLGGQGKITEPVLEWFGQDRGDRRPGNEWEREF